MATGCQQREGTVTVDTGTNVPLATAYRVDLYARQVGLGLVEGVGIPGAGQVTIDGVPEGEWAVLVQAQNGDQTTIAFHRGVVRVKDGQTSFFQAGSFLPGLPGDPVPESNSSLTSFGPNGSALAAAVFTPDATGAFAIQVALELANGPGTTTTTNGRILEQRAGEGEVSMRCATCLLQQHDSEPPEKTEIRTQTTRPSYASIAPGQTIDFFIATTFQNVTCQRILDDTQTENCMIFAEVVAGTPVITPAVAMSIANAFDTDNPFRDQDNGIYDDTRANMGSEWKTNPTGGRDEDERVILVFLSSSGIGGAGFFGFFRPQDQQPLSVNNSSNVGEILYINADRINADLYDGLATIAHEFTHLIIYNEKVVQDGTFPSDAVSENAVLDEGLAVLNEQLNGFDFVGTAGGNFFLISSVDKLLESGLNRPFFQFRGALADYGAGYLFWRYVFDRFGPAVVRTISTSPNTGLANVQAGTGVDFREMFLDFVQAVALNQTPNLPSELTFANLDLVETYTDRSGMMFELDGLEGVGEVTLPGTLTVTETLEPWGTVFRRAVGGDGSPLTWKASGVGTLSTDVYLIGGGQP